MARFSRYLAGGIVGAGLALLFSPKSGREIRRMLMGGGRKALPAPEEYYQPSPAAPAGAVSLDLEAKIEETRRQVEAQLDEALTAAPAVEEEAPVVEEEVAEEEVAEEAPETAPVPQAAPAPEAEAEMEFPAEEAEAAEAEQMVPGEEKETVADMVAAGGKAWEDVLKTPAEGEPTLEAELTVAAEAGEAAPPAAAGIDREEMRRRIDETRARLKAKAFDAMVSGETFIEETGVEKASGHQKAAEPKLEKEVEEQINESLREQD